MIFLFLSNVWLIVLVIQNVHIDTVLFVPARKQVFTAYYVLSLKHTYIVLFKKINKACCFELLFCPN